jgi:hypothetical protein
MATRCHLLGDPPAKVDYYSFVTDKLWQHEGYGQNEDGAKEKSEAVQCGYGGQGDGARARGPASLRESSAGEKEKAGEVQTDIGQAA